MFRPHKALAGLSRKRQLTGSLNLYNTHTGERIITTYRDHEGRYDARALEELNWLLRCHHTDQDHPIDVKTLEFLDRVATRLGCDREIHVISGYRSPKYNKHLLSLGHRVAKRSLHMEGRALDIRIPGTDLPDIRRTAISLRCGGVGYYPRAGFIHIDSGEIRTW